MSCSCFAAFDGLWLRGGHFHQDMQAIYDGQKDPIIVALEVVADKLAQAPIADAPDLEDESVAETAELSVAVEGHDFVGFGEFRADKDFRL